MTPDSIGPHVLRDLHPDHPSGVTAVVTGPQVHVAVTVLETAGWDVVAKDTLVLARIDHEEPYWANDTARELTAEGASVEITPTLQAAIDEEWTCGTSPITRASGKNHSVPGPLRPQQPARRCPTRRTAPPARHPVPRSPRRRAPVRPHGANRVRKSRHSPGAE